ncbi:aminodeoxychorismate lyase [Chitinimonas prasina]|uniref:aminodeoxychorismate lyase n=1 Tax=Chitinimonas prasina TaxID=1434937 RepID=A0ABQ5YK39_9NEIS|nr:aminodeoxychorismate lyase [Chitinimonas prasina]GLR15360.1 aminodeoxychorismate lyase [Chitinimonas prasina]
MTEQTALINGEIDAVISPRDRGLAYGDGVFRTLRCQAGRVLAWPRQYARLQADCERLGMACPDEALWLADLARLAPWDASIKLMVTRGVAARGYACAPDAPPTRLVLAGPLPAYPEALYRDGAAIRLCDWLLPIQPGLAGVKHLNRLDQVMARREWSDPAIFEGLMRNARGELVEGVMSNLYLLQDGCLLTHPLTDCGVAGVMREMVLQLATELGLPIVLRSFDADVMLGAEAVLLSNSLAGVVPVGRCGQRLWQDFSLAAQFNHRINSLCREESHLCLPV